MTHNSLPKTVTCDVAAEARHREIGIDGLAGGGYGGGFQLRVGGQTRRRVSRRAIDIARDHRFAGT